VKREAEGVGRERTGGGGEKKKPAHGKMGNDEVRAEAVESLLLAFAFARVGGGMKWGQGRCWVQLRSCVHTRTFRHVHTYTHNIHVHACTGECPFYINVEIETQREIRK